MAGHAQGQDQSQLPIPPGAKVMALEGPHEPEVRLDVVDLREALRPRYGAVDVWHYSLPDSLSWADIKSFYQSALVDKWTVDDGYPEQRLGYRLRVWRMGDLKPSTIAVGFIEAPADSRPRAMLIIATSRQ